MQEKSNDTMNKITEYILNNVNKFSFATKKEDILGTEYINTKTGRLMLLEEKNQYTLIGIPKKLRAFRSSVYTEYQVINIIRLSISKEKFKELGSIKKILCLSEIYTINEGDKVLDTALDELNEPFELVQIALHISNYNNLDMLHTFDSPFNIVRDRKYVGAFMGCYCEAETNKEIVHMNNIGKHFRILDMVPLNIEAFNNVTSWKNSEYVEKAFELNKTAHKEHLGYT